MKIKKITELLEKQAEKHPNGIAVIFENKQLTYSELDRKSNQLAKFLIESGVQTETFVGLSLFRGLDLIVGILGIVKAGGVYIPIEPSYPMDRIEYMLEDAKPSILLTESSLAPKFTGFPGKLIQLDKVYAEVSAYSGAPLEIFIQPNHLAYVIYTSGSTGKPKGIMVEHGSFVHGIFAHQEFYSGTLVGLLSSGISFDVSILVIFYLLTSGGTVYVLPPESVNDAEKLVDLIENNSFNFLLCVPSLYSMILDKSRKLSFLKIVSLTGENIPNSILALHPEFAPEAILYNEYGPSEYAIGTTIAKIYDPKERKAYAVSIGKPLPDTQVYILDENLRPTPDNTKGEIFIGGAGIARGYLNLPELTANKFVTYQSRLVYRTGDFGRLLPNGNLEFLGRMDYQVKIRGNRVELGEVEHAIHRHPNVNEVVVVVREESDGNKHLVAYFTSLVKSDIKKELKSHLMKLLPNYMVPSAFVQLDSFPRTANGKIDRNSLPDVEKRKEGIEKPNSELEQALIGIWRRVLHIKIISIRDNFFEIGGDSLAIVRVQIMIEIELGVKVAVTELLQYPTISQLAQHLIQQVNGRIVPPYQELTAKKKAAFQQFKKRAGQ